MQLKELQGMLRSLGAAVDEVIAAQTMVKEADTRVKKAEAEGQAFQEKMRELGIRAKEEEARLLKLKAETEDWAKQVKAAAEDKVRKVLSDGKQEQAKLNEQIEEKRAELFAVTREVQKANEELVTTNASIQKARATVAEILRK